jgi:hypothetical protein
VSTEHNPENVPADRLPKGFRFATKAEMTQPLHSEARVWWSEIDSFRARYSHMVGWRGSGDCTYCVPAKAEKPRTATPLAQIRRIYAAATPRQQAAVRRWAGKI